MYRDIAHKIFTLLVVASLALPALAQIQPPAGIGNNIILWLSPDTAVYEAPGNTAEISDRATEWHDISGGGYVFTNNSGNQRPRYVQYQGKNMLSFGGGDIFENNAIASAINGLTEFSIYVVIKSDEQNTDRGFLDSENPDGADDIICMRYDRNGANTGRTSLIKCGMQGNTANNQIESQSNTQTNGLQCLTLTWRQGEQINLYIDGVLNESSVNNVSTAMSGVQKILLGKGPKDTGANDGWDGRIGTVIFYSNKMSPDTVALISGDLRSVYSVQTGDWDDRNTWSSNRRPDASTFVKISPGHTVSLARNEDIANVVIESTGTVNLSANNYTLNLSRNLTNNGSITPTQGTISFTGTIGEQLLDGSGTSEFYNLTVNNNDGVSIRGGTSNIQGTLDIQNGCFETNNSVTLRSNSLGTARLAELNGSACLTGNITMQRYIDAGATDWRFITSAINGATLADLNDDFITSGFAGSDFPLWPSASNPWPSIYYYDETQTGIQDNGFVPASNVTNSIGQGQGVWVFCGDTITGTQPFTIDITGPANTGSINLPISYTNTGLPSDDGWSMVGNPYPSTLDWDDPSITKAGINNAIYVWNPDLQQFGSYSGGIGVNGGSNNIASSQAFWVQATSVSPVLTVAEASKTAIDGSFLKPFAPAFKIRVTNSTGSDETALKFEANASTNYDAEYDAEKISSVNTSVPNITTLIGGKEFSINQFPEHEMTIPVKITSDQSGLNQIEFENAISISGACLKFEDTFTGLVYDLNTTTAITAFLYDTTSIARFVLRIGAPVEVETTNISCFGNNDGKIVFNKETTNPYDITWNDANSTLIQSNTAILTDSIQALSAGTYYIHTTDATCGNRLDTIHINEPAQITSQFATINDTIELGDAFTPTNQSMNALSYAWNFGDGNNSTLTSPIHTFAQAGDYLVKLTASQSATCHKEYSKLITVENVSNSINELAEGEVKTWLNNDLLNINLNSSYYTQVILTNSLGQIVYDNSINKDTFSINLSALSKGMYIVTIIDSQKSSESFKIAYR